MNAQTKVVKNKNLAMPEFIQRNDLPPQSWAVEGGQAIRGDAWTNIADGKMRVPTGDDETSRVVRAHELTHAKVSPGNAQAINDIIATAKVDHQCVIAAEEFRVNMLVAHAGFDVDALADGSESKTGKILGQNNDWNALVRFLPALAGTKGATDLIRGIKSVNPELAKSASELQKEIKKYWKRESRRGVKHIADTRDYNSLPLGFIQFTMPLAHMLNQLLMHEADEFQNDGEIPAPAGGEIRDRIAGNRGMFARLIEARLPKPKAVDGKLGRKRIACNVGKNPRRIDRMLVDPERRIFDRYAKGAGGVILIDQSGSMRLSDDQMWEIIRNAPGCVIIGYSHSAGSTTIPNVWVLADRGKVVARIPDGNGGNGVDGPAIRFAASKRRKGEAFIWVCDGYVTDGASDSQYSNLDDECAKLIAKHGIHMVHDVEGAVKALKKVKNGQRLPVQGTGPLRSKVASLIGR